MELEKWDPWKDFFRIQEEVNTIFNSFFEKLSFSLPGPPVAFSPAVDIYETEQGTVIRISLPGVIQEDMDITLEGKKLIIRGVREVPTDARAEGYVHREWRYGRFERAIMLSFAPRETDLHATYEGGILELRFPQQKKEKEK